jgi:hypothetical protein
VRVCAGCPGVSDEHPAPGFIQQVDGREQGELATPWHSD